MHKKSFTFGAGIAILLMTLLFYFVYANQLGKYKAAHQADIDTLTETIASLNSSAGNTPEPVEVIKEVIVEVPVETFVELTDEEVIEKAMSLGMDFPADTPEPAATPNSVTPRAAPSVVDESEDYVVIKIASGTPSSEISALLQRSGLIESARDFNQFLIDKGVTKRMAYGTFKVSKGLSFEEILAIIGRR